MKTTTRRRIAPPTAPQRAAPDHEQARQRLRAFAAFIERQAPDALAASVTMIDDTLEHCARIEKFFTRYVAALKTRAR